jgi:sodium pump decarboxylase gamma subunit
MDPIIAQGFVLMVAGMSIVYVFLYVLVLAMRGIAIVVPRFNHLLPDDAPKTVKKPAAVAEADDAAVAVAIAAVVARGGR